jgi:3-carboxy-cis,cis-muconate cycloisomerase
VSRESDLLAPAWAGTGAAEIVDDRALVAAMIRVEVALATAQEELGVVPAGVAKVVAATASPEVLDTGRLTEGLRATANPVVAFVDLLGAAVAEHDPAVAEHVHRGGTSQDVLDTALVLLAADALDVVAARLDTAVAGLADLARRHRGTPTAGRTLTQHAVPTTFGLKVATWLQGVLDARYRVRETRARLPVSLGGAAGTLAAYLEHARSAVDDPVGATLALPDLVADELGLARRAVPWHGVRTPVADLAGTLAEVGGVLGKIATDVLVLSRTEIGEVAEDPTAGRGASSAMPQKANPVLATLVVTAARQLPAQTSVLFASMAVEDERSAGGWHAEWQPLREALRLAVGAAVNAAELTGSLSVDPERMATTLHRTDGAIVSERLSARLAGLVGRKEAKALLTASTAEAARSGRDLLDVVDEHLRTRGVDAPDLDGTLDPTAYLGLAEPLVDRVLAAAAAPHDSAHVEPIAGDR